MRHIVVTPCGSNKYERQHLGRGQPRGQYKAVPPAIVGELPDTGGVSKDPVLWTQPEVALMVVWRWFGGVSVSE